MLYNVKRHAVVQPLDQSIRYIPLTQGKIAVVDAADFEALSHWNWFAMRSHPRRANCKWYAARRDEQKHWVTMHRMIIGALPGVLIDHRDGDGLNNRRTNIRIASPTGNAQNRRPRVGNTSGFKGVSWDSRAERWHVQIAINGKNTHVGHFDLKEDAARAYDVAALRHFGEFAYLNFPAKP